MEPNAEIRFWCDKKFEVQARETMKAFDESMRVDVIISGKFRRYNKLALWRQFLRFRTIVLPNAIDAVKVVLGVFQSITKMIVWRPDVVFTKGGFVCVPIGVAARVLGIPLVIHDSDAHPGLANRILARWAKRIATGAPLKYYPYPKDISRYVGIPVQSNLTPVTLQQKNNLKKKIGVQTSKPLIVITGGGLGAERLNTAVVQSMPKLIQMASVILITGAGNYNEVRNVIGEDTDDMQIKGFVSGNMHEYLSAADIVVTRAGMTIIAELAAIGQATVLVPNAYLTGGHQLKNAKVYQDAKAALVLDEATLDENANVFEDTIYSLLNDTAKREAIARSLYTFARPDAARQVADMILSSISKTQK